MILRLNSRNNDSYLSKNNTVFDSIDSEKIGEGKYFTEGKFGHKNNLGLKGQLSKLKRNGRLATKNLSRKNLGDMYNLIANRLKKHSMGYGVHITRNDKMSIMQEAEKLIRTRGSKFSREDKADLESIVDVLKEKSKNSIFKKRYPVDGLEEKQNLPSSNKEEKCFSNDNVYSNSLLEPSNTKQEIHQLDDNDQLLELEDHLDIFNPLEGDDEIENLRNQAKDLAI